jgi:hypothetical protein
MRPEELRRARQVPPSLAVPLLLALLPQEE